MTQEAGSTQATTTRVLMRQRIVCILAYALLWGDTFSLLWFLESNGPETFRHLEYPWRVLLALAWNTLCPDWPFLVVGLVLGLLTCVCLPKIGGAMKSGLLWSSLPAAAILTIFGFTASGLLPAFLAVAASCLAAMIVARTWQQPLFSVPFAGRSLAPRRVVVVLVWLLAMSIPFRLFELLGAAWSRVLPAKITETHSAMSTDEAYIAVIHNVDPNVNDYSDVLIRPSHTFLELFSGSSGGTRLSSVDKIEWQDRRTLRISGNFHPRVETWNDVRIVYNDTADPEERREREALRRDAESR